MNPSELRQRVITTLQGIAPEVDAARLRDDLPLRRQVDLDSMDWLNFLLGLNKALGIEIPEKDYARLTTLSALLDYLQHKLTERSAS
ncbi:MAG: acyl carrier protein [Pseudomonadota bacterium]|uniref:acyl carrier protein n=1 Tax=Sulfuricystis thermophila TaxID=2496847 RepID=UPI001035A8EE|nr:acyl carrier protein [Sulfuricystis thermophila]MDI6748751.1 acyl carrier protein [Rhodocyclaceae bacterium]